MGKKHNKMLRHYGRKDVIEDIFNIAIRDVALETPLIELFKGCNSYKEPDIVAMSYSDIVFIEELKGNFNYRALDRARKQISGYLHEIDKLDYEVEGIIIVGNYKEYISL